MGVSRAMTVLRRIPAVLALAAILAGCSAETRRCHELMTSAQALVTNVNAKDRASVAGSLAAVEAARAACEKAGRQTEYDELLGARNQLKAHLDYLERKSREPPPKKVTPEELATFLAHGDPSCPRGQAYRPRDSQKEVRCTGPQIADMSWGRAEQWFRARGYKITTTDAPPTLRAEYGAELFVFTYGVPKDEGAPRCLAIYPPPGASWQEAVARATGTSPEKLAKATTVKVERGAVPLAVLDTEKTVVASIGDCGS